MSIATEPLPPPTDDDPSPRRPFLFEVVAGRVVRCRPMGSREGVLASWLVEVMGPFARSRGLGRVVSEVLFGLDPARKLGRRPDVAFVSAGRWPMSRRVPRKNAWAVVPDLAVEVVGPANTAEEIAAKVRDYLACGVLRVWVLYPGSETAYVYSSARTFHVLTRDEELDGEDLIPGLRLPLAEVFGDDEA